ncbi:SDR family oxidoreductase [Rubrivirga marina]|uniref:NAD(P)-dependent oxidoreductase n=1 Tax=Rubrivirga marina TaxID=1196024 RepID=A0A271J1F9_9BACT|nr:SDR family oxidoreductase [Rubrivirga marina]PAP77346.1 NAD(P)-dependent oxidoreductase [Rubrivirga marina]
MTTGPRDYPDDLPAQHQDEHPGDEHEMTPEPDFDAPDYRGSGKLDGQAALITGGDSGIGRAVAVLYAREGADVAIVYLDEDEDAQTTVEAVEAEGQRCLAIRADVRDESACHDAVQRTVDAFGRLDVLVNNAAVQVPQERIGDITAEQLDRTFRTNIYSQFFMTKAALGRLSEGGAIINTTSVTAFRGSPGLLDYASTKGAILAFTRSLAQNEEVLDKKIRVNCVAPGPIWTPFIPSSFDEEKVSQFGKDVPLERPGQPEEVAPAYVYLASAADSSYVLGQTIHVNGGEVVGG